MIETQKGLERQIDDWGFLPFFRNKVKGFSIEELVPEGLLFGEHGGANEVGAWQWKGPIIRNWNAAYGKFFGGKAGFVSLDWLPELMNWRRAKYPLSQFDADTLRILDVLRKNESMLSKELKTASGFQLSRKRFVADPNDSTQLIENKNNGPSFDARIAQLQMATYVCVADFEYSYSRSGEPYGWGVARYCTPEAMYEIDIDSQCEGSCPEESQEIILRHLHRLFPEARVSVLEKLI